MSEPRRQPHRHAHGIGVETIRHARTITAQDTALSVPVDEAELARSVMVKLGGRMALVVIGDDRRLDLAALSRATGRAPALLAEEREFAALFPHGELGAMPRFGNRYGIDVYVDDALSQDHEIVFNAGSPAEAIRIPFALLEQLVHPRRLRRIANISQ